MSCSMQDCERPVHGRGYCQLHYFRMWRHGDPSRGRQQRTLEDHYDVAESGCWEWSGALSDGYGQIQVEGNRWLAHRYSYVLAGNEIPDGHEVDHLCRNRACVNPAHLEAVTQYENNMRSTSPAAIHARKTECVNGHEFSDENTYRYPNGSRACKACRRVNQERYLARRRGVVA